MDLSEFLPTSVTTVQIVLAVISVLIGSIAAHFARGGVLKLAKRTPGISDSVAHLAARFVQYMLLLVGIGVGLAFLGANVQPLLAMTAIAVVVLILVLRGVADNFAAGVLIQSRQPVKVGEEIVAEGPDGVLQGIVQELTGRSVIIVTADGKTAHVPNSLLLTEILVNHSRHGARRSEVQIRIARSTEHSLEQAIDLAVRGAEDVDGVHSREHPVVLVRSISPTRWILVLRVWHHPLHTVTVLSSLVTRVAERLSAAGMETVVTSEKDPTPLVVADSL